MFRKNLLEKILSKEAEVGVVGLGYVGLPLAMRFTECGFKVTGFDIDENKIAVLNSGGCYLQHLGDHKVKAMLESQAKFTSNFQFASQCDALIICVPTPLGKHNEPNLEFITTTLDSLLPFLKRGQVLSLESTTYPGTTEELLLPAITDHGFSVGDDIFLLYSPEREDPGNEMFSTKDIPKIVGGHSERCLEIGVSLYSSVINKVVPVSSTKVAEMTKILENIYRAVNIGLVNEMKMLADLMGIDIHEVIRAAATKPFGFTAFYPGPGLGGHCIPIDPFYLTWKAKEFGMATRFIELAGEINTKMPEWVVSKVGEALNDRYKPIKGSKILILGIAYKKNIDDMRESPSVELMKNLKERGADISYSDPHVPVFPVMRNYDFDLKSEEVTAGILAQYDCVILATDHDEFDYELIKQNSDLLVDTRGKFLVSASNVVKA